jgi:Mg/Co/Ni transporter MgtE
MDAEQRPAEHVAHLAPEHEAALSLAFMQGHPSNAARVLEALPIAEAAALFDRAPARIGGGVMAAMLPRQASACVAALSDARALELLATMNMQAMVSLLRYIPEARRQTLIGGLPTASALASALLLGYDEDTLGAWADPSVIMLPPETRAADALARVRQTEVAHPAVFVTDASRRLAGLVGLATLLRAPEGATLATLMQSPAAVLRAHALLASATSHPGWTHASALPVVEPGERLLGVMTRDALTRAQRRDQVEPGAAAAVATLPALLALGYWETLSGMVSAGLGLMPRVGPVVSMKEGPDDGR